MYEFLDKCSKEEIIYMLKSKSMYEQFSYTDILSNRWQTAINKLRVKEQAHMKLGELVLGKIKERNKIAKLFNETSNTTKKLEYITKLKKYSDETNKWINEGNKLEEERKKIDKLYTSIHIERSK